MVTIKECCDASVAAFGLIYNAIEADKQFPEHLSIEAYISCHTEAMKLFMTGKINESKGKPFTIGDSQPPSGRPIDQPQSERRTGEDSGGGNPCTEKMAKAVFVITHDKVGSKWERNKNFIELETYGIIKKDEIKNMNYDDAHEFIEKFGN